MVWLHVRWWLTPFWAQLSGHARAFRQDKNKASAIICWSGEKHYLIMAVRTHYMQWNDLMNSNVCIFSTAVLRANVHFLLINVHSSAFVFLKGIAESYLGIFKTYRDMLKANEAQWLLLLVCMWLKALYMTECFTQLARYINSKGDVNTFHIIWSCNPQKQVH